MVLNANGLAFFKKAKDYWYPAGSFARTSSASGAKRYAICFQRIINNCACLVVFDSDNSAANFDFVEQRVCHRASGGRAIKSLSLGSASATVRGRPKLAANTSGGFEATHALRSWE